MKRPAITRFSGEYEFLSNFYPCTIVHQGITYRSVEAAYQASKTLNLRTRQTFSSMTASQAKQAGKKLMLRPDWEQVKVRVMESLLWQKFSPDGAFAMYTKLGLKLIATDPAELIEGNTWGDCFWGRVDGQGRNELGKILMNIRNIIIVPF